MEFNFNDEPIVHISKCEYDEMKSWSGISVSEHWGFYYPVNGGDEFKYAIFKKIKLTEITSKNVKELIIDQFNTYKNWNENY